MNRLGFTLIELLVVILIIGILANLGFPALSRMKRKAEAAHIIADFSTVRVAALDYYAAHGDYPPTGNFGTPPTELTASLPGGFSFTFGAATYRWHRWSLPDGSPSDPSQTVLLGLDVHSTDLELMAALTGQFRGGAAFGTPTDITLIVE